MDTMIRALICLSTDTRSIGRNPPKDVAVMIQN